MGLLAGYTVTMTDQADQNGLFTVQVGGTGTSVTNQGLIAAATAELRANGGNIYALAGNTSSVIKATQVTHQGGQIFLTAPGGTVTVASGVTLDASGTGSGSGGHILVDSANTSFHGTALAEGGPLGGDGGLVETSGDVLDFSGAKVDTTAAHGATGTWLLDPYRPHGGRRERADAEQRPRPTAPVVVQTTGATSHHGPHGRHGHGQLRLGSDATSPSTRRSAGRPGNTSRRRLPQRCTWTRAITVAGGGGAVITTNDGGRAANHDFGLTGAGFTGSISYTGGSGSLTINTTPYTLLYSMSDVAGRQQQPERKLRPRHIARRLVHHVLDADRHGPAHPSLRAYSPASGTRSRTSPSIDPPSNYDRTVRRRRADRCATSGWSAAL